jgi:hypothetical protein
MELKGVQVFCPRDPVSALIEIPDPLLRFARSYYIDERLVRDKSAVHGQCCRAAVHPNHDFGIFLPAEHTSLLVGSWDLEVLHYAAVDVAPLHIQGEVHFCWVLEGRAIQDVWIMPRASERNANLAKTNNMYGTTLRIWDASIQAWRIRWINPVTNHYEQQIGRRVGPRKDDNIVQVGARIDGTPTRWRFTEITADSFH